MFEDVNEQSEQVIRVIESQYLTKVIYFLLECALLVHMHINIFCWMSIITYMSILQESSNGCITTVKNLEKITLKYFCQRFIRKV